MKNPLYRIEKTMTIWWMQRKATELMLQGWQVQGGVIKSWGLYYQAFVKQ